MKILVTGATGFVGGKLTKKLLDLGHEIRVLSRSGEVPRDLAHQNLEVVKGDVTDLASLERACAQCESVFHLAGVVGYSRAMRQEMTLANVVGTANVLDACEKNKIQKLFYMSSVVTIGASFTKDVLRETSPYLLQDLQLGYFETKRKAEELVIAATRAGRLQAYIANPATIYGAGDAQKGSRRVQVKVAQGKFKLYTSGGVNVVHIDDCIDGCLRIFERGRPGERYILAGENLTVKQLFTLIAEAAGVKPPFIHLPNLVVHTLGKIGDWQEKRGRKGLITSENAWTSTLYHWFTAEKARQELGFTARPARAAIQESVRWMKENKIIR